MRAGLSQVWSEVAAVGVRPRTLGKRMRVIGVGVVAGALAGGVGFGAFSAHSDVRLAADGIAVQPFTVGLTVVGGGPPSGDGDGPGLDSGPSDGLVREGDPVTYVVDIGVRNGPLSDVAIDLPVPRGFTLMSVPDYCGAGSGIDEVGLMCRVGDLEAQRKFTRTVTMAAGPDSGTGGQPIAAMVTADHGAVRVRSGEVVVRVTTTAGVCDPRGISTSGAAIAPGGPVSADGRISGLVTSGPAEAVKIEGADQCGHRVVRTVTPFEGHFSFVGLLPGTYRLTLDGRAPVNVVLQPGAMVFGGLTF